MIAIGEAVYLTFVDKVGTVENIVRGVTQTNDGGDWIYDGKPYITVRYLISYPVWLWRRTKWFDGNEVKRIIQ